MNARIAFRIPNAVDLIRSFNSGRILRWSVTDSGSKMIPSQNPPTATPTLERISPVARGFEDSLLIAFRPFRADLHQGQENGTLPLDSQCEAAWVEAVAKTVPESTIETHFEKAVHLKPTDSVGHNIWETTQNREPPNKSSHIKPSVLHGPASDFATKTYPVVT